jgi:phage/plasmid-associated DNA primase
MTSRIRNSTKTRSPSTGKKRVPAGKARSKAKRAELPPDDDEWLSIDDLEAPVWTAEDLVAPPVQRAADGTIIPQTYTPADVRRAIDPDDPSSYDYGWVATPPASRLSNGKCASCGRLVCRGLLSCRGASAEEFVASYEAGAARMRKAVREDRLAHGWEDIDLPSPERRRELQARMEELRQEAAKWTEADIAASYSKEGKYIGPAYNEKEGRWEKQEQKEQPMGNGKDHEDNDGDGDDDKNTTPGAKAKKLGEKKDPLHIKIARSFIALMDTDNRLQRFTDVEGRSLMIWKYEKGLWSWLPDRNVAKWLAPQLQEILNYLSKEKNSTVKVLNEAAQHVIRHEKVCIDDDAIFDQHGKVPTRDGLIDPITLEIEPLKPDHFATWVLPKVKYDKDATCPYWEQMLNDALSDKPKAERDLDIQLIQEWMGMSLLDAKPKALQRALILLGLGDTGKTSLQQVMAGMLSSTWITTPLSALSGAHGTQSFIKRAPWVLGEAFTTSIWHLADIVKMILGGDNIDINPKNKDAICVKPNAPAIWATNHPPKFKEPTRAIVERIVMLELTKVFDKTKPIGVAVAAAKINPGWWPHDLVLNTERAGVLNWMLEGAKRALDRGHYINTRAGEALLEGILDDSNVARAFNKDCVEFDPGAMTSAPDYRAALVQWWEEHHGDDIKPPNATMIGVHLKALGDPRILQDKDKFRDDDGKRFYLGIKLNQAGLDHWLTASLEERQSGRKSATRTSPSAKSVAQQIKPEWLKLPEVVTMQKAHRKDD